MAVIKFEELVFVPNRGFCGICCGIKIGSSFERKESEILIDLS